MTGGGESYSPETCAWCYGRGRRSANDKCGVCNGKGKLMVRQPPERCRECNCTGRLSDTGQKCPRCGGSGWEGVLSARGVPGG